MGVLGETLAGNSDLSRHVLEIGGRKVTVKLIDQGVKLGFERHFYAATRERAQEMCDAELAAAAARQASPSELEKLHAEHEELLVDLKDDYQTGKFALLSRRGRKSLSEPEGMLRLLTLLTGCTESELFATLRDRAKQAEINSVLSAVIAESFPGIAAHSAGSPGKKKD